jgi:hypothetical protein
MFGLLFGFAGAMLFVFLVASERQKLVIAGIGGIALVLAAIASGNPRLFCLYGLMITMPLNLDKTFGTVLNKGGGEYAFRIEASDPLVGVLLLFILYDAFTGRRAGIRIPPLITSLWLVIIGMTVLTIIAGPWRMTAAHEFVRQVKVLVLFLVIVNELERSRQFLHCMVALGASTAFQGLVGVVQRIKRSHLGLEFLGETSSDTINRLAENSVRVGTVFRASGLLVHPNLFGVFLACLLPLMIAGFLHYRVPQRYKLLFLMAIPLGMVSLISTMSRSGWASFSVAFAVLMALLGIHPGLRRRTMVAAVVAVAGLAIVVVAFRGPIMTRLFKSRPDAVLGRAEYNESARKMIAEKPWTGWGVNGYVYAVPPYTPVGARLAHEYYNGWIPPVHNIYYLWAAETGIPGLMIHLWLLAAVIWTALQNLRVRDDILYALNAAVLAAMAAFLVDGFFSFTLRLNSLLRVFWIFAGFVVAIRYWRLRDARESAREAEPPAEAVPPPNRLAPLVPVRT